MARDGIPLLLPMDWEVKRKVRAEVKKISGERIGIL